MRNDSIKKWMTAVLPVLGFVVLFGCDRWIPQKLILPETYEAETTPIADLDIGSVCFLLADSLVFPDSTNPRIDELADMGWSLDTSYTLTEVETIVLDTSYTGPDSTEIDTVTADTVVMQIEVFRDILAARDLGEPMTLDSLPAPDDYTGVPELLSGADTDSHLVAAIPVGKGAFVFDNTIDTRGRLVFYYDDYVDMQIWELTDDAIGDLIPPVDSPQSPRDIADCQFKKSRFDYVLPPEKVLVHILAQEQTIKLKFPMVLSAGE